MKMSRILALLLALMLALSAVAFAEDATEAPAAEATEAPADDEAAEAEADPVIAEFGDVQIRVSDALPQFESYYQMMSGYGFDMSAYAPYIKQQVLLSLVQQEIEKQKTEELGFNELTEEEQAEAVQDAADRYNEMFNYYLESFTYNGAADPEAETTAYLEKYGYTPESTLAKAKQSMATNKMVDSVTADLVVTDEDLKAYYDEAVAEDQQAYEDNYAAYEQDRSKVSEDDVIAWNPEGYRRVRQVLIALDSDGKTRYSALSTELDNIRNGEESARTEEEVQAEIDQLFAPLYETASEVRTKFDEGASIDDLIAEYGSDPGMTTEPGLTEGYYVCANSQIWDPAFVEAAMSVDAIGQLSEPKAGSYGLYMVYYLADVTPGAVPYEDVRDVLDPQCQTAAKRAAYYDQLDAWSEELGVQFYLDKFVTSYDN